MNGAKQFDRWVLVTAVLVFALICVFGMYIGNAAITDFGKYGFTGAWSAMLILLNRELITNNGTNGSGTAGNGNKESSGIPDPTH